MGNKLFGGENGGGENEREHQDKGDWYNLSRLFFSYFLLRISYLDVSVAEDGLVEDGVGEGLRWKMEEDPWKWPEECGFATVTGWTRP
jgi:hypothetical protein